MKNEITHKTDGSGHFAKGNRWMVPRWRKGQVARLGLTPNKIAASCNEYIEQQLGDDENPKVLTHSGLARTMNISYRQLMKYRNGEVGTDTTGIVHILDCFSTYVLDQLETMLPDKQYATAGITAALQHHYNWQNKQIIEHKTSNPIAFVLDSNSELAKQLNEAGSVVIDQIENDDN